jgi:hypothetical protein
MKRHNVTAGFQNGKSFISASTFAKPSLALEKGKEKLNAKYKQK